MIAKTAEDGTLKQGTHVTQLTSPSPADDTRREAVHDWYRFVLGYESQLVSDLLDRFAPRPTDGVFDPFCGTGTTLVECRKRGLATSGLDANPVATFVTAAKLSWDVPPAMLLRVAKAAHDDAVNAIGSLNDLDDDALMSRLSAIDGFTAFETFGLVERNWIGLKPLLKVLSLRGEIGKQSAGSLRSLLTTALLSVTVHDASNLKFGPEAYCALRRDDAPVMEAFLGRVERMAADLAMLRNDIPSLEPTPRVVAGDARDATAVRRCRPIGYVITSPPYPNEKDYTRNTRLEMVLLDTIADNDALRVIKKGMIRSHSKGIYKDDADGGRIARFARITAIVDELREKCRHKTYGFAKQYPKVIAEYFGGMHRHFDALIQVAEKGCRAAYVVGQQRTYLQTHVPTAACLAELAEDVGWTVEGIETYRIRRGTTGSKHDIPEEVLFIRR